MVIKLRYLPKERRRGRQSAPPATPNPKISVLEKRLAGEKDKLEKAVAGGKPDKSIRDRIYELEDELRLIKEK